MGQREQARDVKSSPGANVSGERPFLSFRRIETKDELYEHFRARHDEYLRCGYRHKADPHNIDIDEYDVFSDHIGVFQYERGTERMVGGIRAIWPGGETECASAVRALVAEFCPLRLETLHVRKTPLPSEDAFDLGPLLEPMRADGVTVVEFSRTFAVPDVRGRGVGSALAHAIHVLARYRGARYGIGSCALDRVSFYERSGARVLEEAGIHIYPGVNVPARALLVDLHALPAEADRYARSLGILLAPQNLRRGTEVRVQDEDARASPTPLTEVRIWP